jgi:glycosyltransferase involved in cell wall biosynthesis
MKKLPISVCLVAAAEAHRVGNALESVAGWTSEIVIVINEEVDDGTDRIAERYGARVFRESWKGFVGQKNSAAEKASQPWLLNLDADEVVSPPLREEIQRLWAQTEPTAAAYSFPRCTFYCGRWIRHGDWYPDRVRRLWRKSKAIWVGQEPHAQLQVEGRLEKLNADLLHFSNESIARQIAKIVPYQEGLVRDRLAAGQSSGFFSLVVRPWWRFVRAYIFRGGFLDGWPGYYIAKLTAFSTLTRYTMVKEAQLKKGGPA